MTAGPAPVEAGALHLLAAPDGDHRRTMDYLVPFTAADGTELLLRGTKAIQRGRRNGPWRATTRLASAIVDPDDQYEALAPTGLLTISVTDVVRLAASIRPTSTTGPVQGVRTLARLGTFFAGAVAAAYLGASRPHHQESSRRASMARRLSRAHRSQ